MAAVPGTKRSGERALQKNDEASAGDSGGGKKRAAGVREIGLSAVRLFRCSSSAYIL